MKKWAIFLSVTVICWFVFTYDAWADLDAGLMAYFPFNGNAVDETGYGHDGTVHGATLVIDRFGNPDSAYSFDGVDDYIDVAQPNDFGFNNQSFSISVWVQVTNAASPYEEIFILTDSDDNFPHFQLSRGGEHPGQIFVSLYDSGYSQIATNHSQLPVATWIHVISIVNCETDRLELYCDGTLHGAVDLVSFDFSSVPLAARIGAHVHPYGDGEHLSGAIDDVRIYNRVLSNAEIQALYNESPVGPDTLTLTAPNGDEMLMVNTNYPVTWLSQGQIDTVLVEYSADGGLTWTVISPNAANTGTYDWLIPEIDSNECLVRISDSSNLEVFDISDGVLTIEPESNDLTYGLIAYYPFNGNAIDESYNNHDGTVYGAALTTDRFGNPDSAYSFDGDDDYIDITNASDFGFANESFSVSVWAYVIENRPVYESFVGLGSTERQYCINKWRFGDAFYTEFDHGPSIVSFYPDGGLQSNTWYHLVSVVNVKSGNMEFYGNGILVGTNSLIDFNFSLGTVLRFGMRPDIGNYLLGAVDDVCIYDRALSGTEITALYPMPAPPPPEQPTVSVLAPNGGESLTVSDFYTVMWDSTGSITDVLIEYSTDNGAIWITVDTVSNIGLYDWLVAVADSTDCLIVSSLKN